MAVTQDEERAAKISDGHKKDIADRVQSFKDGKVKRAGTRMLFKKESNGVIKKGWYAWFREGGNIIIERISGSNKYQSVVKGTKTKEPIDRLETEVLKKITKDLRNAWCESEARAKTISATTLKKPMLLHKWEKQKQKITYPCYAQPKHDGIRAMYDGETGKLYSRSGKVIDLPHITDQLQAFNAVSLDGEIAFDDFTVPLPEVIHAISAKDIDLKFMVFDNLSDDNIHLSFQVRFINMLPGWFRLGGLVAHCDAVRITDTQEFHSEEEIDAYYEVATQAGMEGIVVRNANSPYAFGKRTMFTLKYKMEYEEKFLVEGYQVIPHPKGDLIQFICTFNGKQFEVVPAWKHSERRKCLELLDFSYRPDEKISGLPTILIEYRGITPDGKPYHAVGKTTWKNFKKEV